MIAGIVLAVMIPLLILAYCCFRKQRRNHKKGLENKALKILTTSRHSLNESGPTVTKSKEAHNPVEANWKKENQRTQFSSGNDSVSPIVSVRSSPPDIKADVSTNSTFDHSSTRSPISNTSGGKTSPSTESQSSSSQASRGRDRLDSASRGRDRLGSTSSGSHRQRAYDGVYYTHEPIKGAPVIDFEEKVMDLEINHRNTEV